METLTRKAYAKINLTLDVVRKREDGYHDLRTVMQSVDVYDTLTFTKTKDSAVRLETAARNLPQEKDNLIVRAAERFRAHCHITEGVHIDLVKEIPVAAGMGGGSTDAACTLRSLNDLFAAGLSAETLSQLALEIGSDVPFCLTGGTMLAEGRGEILTPLKSPPACTILIAAPQQPVSTAEIFQSLTLSQETSHPDVDGVCAALMAGDLRLMCRLAGNVLEPVTRRRVSAIGELIHAMLDYGAVSSIMSGSGPAVFGIFDDEHDAVKAYHVLKGKGNTAALFVSRPVRG